MYDYSVEKKKVFTEEGQIKFLKIRDGVKKLLSKSGAITMGRAMSLDTGISWENMACVDRLVELGEIVEIPTSGAGQERVFV